MNKRVHQIAKEQGLTAKELLARLREAGHEVKAASSNFDEALALKVLSNGGNSAAPEAPAAAAPPAASQPRSEAPPPAPTQAAAGDPPKPAPDAPTRPEHKQRPTRDSLQGERAPGAAGGRRRVVIDSQASRRAGGGPPTSQPPRRQRRGRRRRGVYDELAESRPAATPTEAAPAVRVNSGSTVKDVAEYLDVPVPEVMKKLMALGEMKTRPQTLTDDAIHDLATELVH